MRVPRAAPRLRAAWTLGGLGVGCGTANTTRDGSGCRHDPRQVRDRFLRRGRCSIAPATSCQPSESLPSSLPRPITYPPRRVRNRDGAKFLGESHGSGPRRVSDLREATRCQAIVYVRGSLTARQVLAVPSTRESDREQTDPRGGRSYRGGPLGAQRGLHGVLRDPHHPRDHLDRHLLGSVRPAYLRPVLHSQHLASLPGSARARVPGGGQDPRAARGQFSRVDDTCSSSFARVVAASSASSAAIPLRARRSPSSSVLVVPARSPRSTSS